MMPRDLVIQADVNPVSLTGAVRQAIWSIDQDQPVSHVMTFTRLLAVWHDLHPSAKSVLETGVTLRLPGTTSAKISRNTRSGAVPHPSVVLEGIEVGPAIFVQGDYLPSMRVSSGLADKALVMPTYRMEKSLSFLEWR